MDGCLASHDQAALALRLLLGTTLTGRHVGRLSAEVGNELVAQRDADVTLRRRRRLPPRSEAPEAAAVEVDGGRIRTRAVEQGPGVHQFQHKEEKVACLVSLKSSTHETDPRPDVPAFLLNARRVRRLVQQIKGGTTAEAEPANPAEVALAEAEAVEATGPKKLVRTCVASMAKSRLFGPMMAAEAQSRGFYAAKKKAFVADGLAYNWRIHKGYFADFEPVVDFLHVVCYLYLAAQAVGEDEPSRWSAYLGWARDCWQGRAAEATAELKVWRERLGRGPPSEADRAERLKAVQDAARYLSNNQGRMDYPRYRRQGLPVTSSLVESLVGEFNARLKGTNKYWNRPAGAEAMLQVRAAVLSDDDRLARYFAQRPGNPFRRKAR